MALILEVVFLKFRCNMEPELVSSVMIEFGLGLTKV